MEQKFHGSESSLYALFAPGNERGGGKVRGRKMRGTGARRRVMCEAQRTTGAAVTGVVIGCEPPKRN